MEERVDGGGGGVRGGGGLIWGWDAGLGVLSWGHF